MAAGLDRQSCPHRLCGWHWLGRTSRSYNLLTRIFAAWDLFWRSLVSRTERPARFAIVAAALALAGDPFRRHHQNLL
jgi:hypothetical protein